MEIAYDVARDTLSLFLTDENDVAAYSVEGASHLVDLSVLSATIEHEDGSTTVTTDHFFQGVQKA